MEKGTKILVGTIAGLGIGFGGFMLGIKTYKHVLYHMVKDNGADLILKHNGKAHVLINSDSDH